MGGDVRTRVSKEQRVLYDRLALAFVTYAAYSGKRELHISVFGCCISILNEDSGWKTPPRSILNKLC